MRRVYLCEPHVSIDASAGIPARDIDRIVQSDSNHVVALYCVRRKVETPRGVGIGLPTNKLAVQPDHDIGHGAADIEVYGLVTVRL
jgi:hypothetical protein